MSHQLAELGHWSWMIAGLLLMALELAAPGVLFFWLGVAAVLTGLIDWVFDLPWQASFLVFGLLATGAVLVGRRLLYRPNEESNEVTHLNRRGYALIGRVFTLETPIQAGDGRVRVGDSSWRVIGPDASAGTRVRVVRVEDATLVVEPAQTSPRT